MSTVGKVSRYGDGGIDVDDVGVDVDDGYAVDDLRYDDGGCRCYVYVRCCMYGGWWCWWWWCVCHVMCGAMSCMTDDVDDDVSATTNTGSGLVMTNVTAERSTDEWRVSVRGGRAMMVMVW